MDHVSVCRSRALNDDSAREYLLQQRRQRRIILSFSLSVLRAIDELDINEEGNVNDILFASVTTLVSIGLFRMSIKRQAKLMRRYLNNTETVCIVDHAPSLWLHYPEAVLGYWFGSVIGALAFLAWVCVWAVGLP